MKKIHIFLTLLAAAALAVAISGCSSGAKKSYYLGRANHWFDTGQFAKAEIEYLNVLHVDPQNPIAIGRLGVIYFDEGRFQKAAPFLYKGSQLATNDLDLHLKLAQVYLLVGMQKEAHGEAEFVLDQNPQDTEAPVLFAQSAAKPADVAATRQKLQTLAQQGANAGLETALGMLAMRNNDSKTAVADFQKATTLDSHFAPAYSALGILYSKQNDLTKAAAACQAASDAAPAYSPLQLEYGQFEIQAGNLPTAEQFFNDFTTRTPNYLPGWLGLAEVALDEKKFDDCTNALGKALAMDSENADALVLDARLDLARSDLNQGTAKLERLVKLYPGAARIHYQLALAYVMGGQANQALNQSHEALNLEPQFFDAAFLLAQLELKNGETDSAVGQLKQLVAERPGLTQVQLVLADAYRIQGNFNSALEIYKELEKTSPQDPQIPLFAGATFADQQNEAAARQEFNRVLQIQPDNVSAQLELAQLDLADQQFAAAQTRVEQLISKHPQQAFPQMMLAKIYLAQGLTNQAETALMKAAALPESSSANSLLAQLYLKSGKDQKALDVLNNALEKNPKDPSLLMLIGVVQSNQKNWRASADAYEKVLALNPQYSPALNNLAWLYCDKLGDLGKAFDLARRARQLLPNDPSTADTFGWVQFKQGQYAPALKLFQESANALSDNPEVEYHLGLANYMLGDEDASRGAFQNALGSGKDFPEHAECQNLLDILNIDPKTADPSVTAKLENRMSEKPDDPIAFARLAAIYQRDNNTQKTVTLCETALKANPQNVNAEILLAQLYAATDPQKAFALAKAAYQLKPNDTRVCATLGRMTFLNGDDKWAFTLLSQASQDEPNNAQTLMDYANAAFCLGKISEAQTAVENALQTGLPATQSTDAKNLLAMIILSQTPEQATAAQSHVQQILASNPDDPAALFVDAVINTQNNDPVGAERDYEKLLGRHPHCAAAEKNLAILYAQNLVEPEKAYPIAVEAREAFPDDPQVARALALILFQRGDYNRAADLLDPLSGSTLADAQLFYCLGISEFRLKNFTESRKSLQHALNLNLSGQEASDARQTLAELSN
jgi:tetratricopeptide (TPR) repeat protein